MAKLLASSGQGIYRIRIVDILRDVFERAIDVVSFIIFCLIALVGIYAIIDAHKVEASAQLDSEVKNISSEIASAPEHSFEELKEINEDIVAWLRIDDTPIDFPVVWTNKDNVKYLTRNYRGENATAGAAFIDYRNNGVSDYYTVIYGHRMSGERMFSSVTKFNDADFFNTHKTGVFFTPSGTYDLEVILSARPNVSESQIYNVQLYRNSNYENIKALFGNDINQIRNIKMAEGDKLLLLSTCDKDANHFRNVVLLKMTLRDENNK